MINYTYTEKNDRVLIESNDGRVSIHNAKDIIKMNSDRLRNHFTKFGWKFGIDNVQSFRKWLNERRAIVREKIKKKKVIAVGRKVLVNTKAGFSNGLVVQIPDDSSDYYTVAIFSNYPKIEKTVKVHRSLLMSVSA